ncbi:MAG TPA: HAMP domain-containing sensor histidine kinase [Nitrososphaeraceae archaeon]|nr:HAMP domain-containing sensor histidine kinase [Nitrososphaeraceae archaeon]
MLRNLNSKIILKISIFIIIVITLIIGSFGVLAYFQSQGSSTGNSINIAGKNRYLTANLLLQTEKYLDGSSNISQLEDAMYKLQTNIMTLKQGGTISGINLRSLPSDFLDLSRRIDEDWSIFKTYITNNLLKRHEDGQVTAARSNATAQSTTERKNLELLASNLIGSSDALVTKLGRQADTDSQNLMLLQILFGILIIGILVLVLYFVARILRPISALTQATSEIEKGNLDVSVKRKGNDELSVLSDSFNSMVNSIKRYNERQNELTKALEFKNDELTETEKDLRRANEELVNTETAKEEFLSMISHELKTPLTPLKMYAEMLLKIRSMGELNEKQLKAMKMILRSISQLELLVNDIFDVYKLDIGKLQLNKNVVQVASLVKENMSELGLLMRDKQIQFNAEIIPPSEKVNVLCDPRRIGQVLANLIKNSVDFVPDKGGRITIRTEAGYSKQTNDGNSNYVVFTIEDNGSGIPFEKINNLFKKFYQVDTSTKRKHGGTGLGLAICNGIVEGHGGKIWVDTKHSQGAMIKFTLPIADSNAPGQNDNS